MKKILKPILLLSVFIFTGCGIQKKDIVTCVGGTKDFQGEVMYKKRNYIVLSGITNYYEYGDSSNCPVEKDKYGNCVWEAQKTGQWILNIIEDYCTRDNNYGDMVRIRKQEDKNNK